MHSIQPFLPHDAMLAWYMLSSCVCLYICWSVCLSQASTVPKWLNVGSHKQCHTIAQGLNPVFWCQRSRRHSDGVMSNRGWVGYNWPISTYISLYLSNGAWQRHSYYKTLIGTCMHSIKLCYFQWPWVTLTTPTIPFYHILYRLSCLHNKWR